MKLIIDVGNSYIKCGLLNNNKITKFKMYETNKSFSLNDFKNDKYGTVIFSSVVKEMDKVIKDKIKKVKLVNINKLNKKIKLKVNCKKEEIGDDLYADLIAANKLYKAPLIIFDIGTVSKVLAINKHKEFIGASFFPGLEASKNSLSNETSKLPNIDLTHKVDLIGKTTKECIDSGITYSTLFAIKGFANEYKKVLGKSTKIILTGGGAKILEKSLKGFIYNPMLTLLGIYYIYKENI